MRRSSFLLLLGSAMSTTAVAVPMVPPILPGAPSAVAIDQRCDMYVARSTAMRRALERSGGTPTVNVTLAAYDRLNALLADASGEATLYRQVSPTAASRSAGEKCEGRISSEATKLSLSRPIYDRIKVIKAPAADAATRLYLDRVLKGFERSGIALDDAGRAKAQALSDKASKLSTQFVANIPKGQRTISATSAELAGLPQDFIDLHKPGSDGKITLTTDYTDYIPVMTYAKDGGLRERLYRAYNERAYPDNGVVLRDLIDTRDDLAHLVGRPNYAALNFEDRMLNTPAKVQALFDEMAAAAKPAADRDYAKKLAALQQLQPGATRIAPWDNTYLAAVVQKQSYGYDRQAARQYFAYDNVRDGILRLTEDMFGVEIRPWKAPTWDKLVESYELYDHGKLIGRFHFNSHPRPGKYEHANSVSLRTGTKDQIPVGILVMNLPAGKGLMEHSDVETFLHEFGHLLHGMFGGQNQRWASQSGVATEWDFVEAPSQMLENWVYDYDVLKGFARDASGHTIPRELVEKMNRARYFSLGMDDMRQLGLSNVSLQFHLGRAPADLGGSARADMAKYDAVPPAPFSQFQDSFPHLAEYGAAYYTYRWSIVIADDMFTQFQAHGLRDRATAERYRRLVLAPGGSKPAAELVSDFLGRPISIDAYRAKLAKDQ